jgi:hypothetical protein
MQIHLSGPVPINELLDKAQPHHERTPRSPRHIVWLTPVCETVRRPATMKVPHSDPRWVDVEPRKFVTTQSPLNSVLQMTVPQTEFRSPTPDVPADDALWDVVLPANDPLWDVMAAQHMAGRVKTPEDSMAYHWYEEVFFKHKKRKFGEIADFQVVAGDYLVVPPEEPHQGKAFW